MLQELVNRNEDLRKLQNEGYELEECGGYLIIHHIPYVANVDGNPIAKDSGKFVVKLNLSGYVLNKPFDHTAFFIGSYPCNIDGTPISGVVNNSNSQNLGNNILVDHYLSNKPVNGRELSYYDKIIRYESIISRPAMVLNPKLAAKMYKPIISNENISPFNYIDTMSSRYDIQTINDKLLNDKIAIIGLGGTGSYVLDFLAKTPVKEIHLFDGDDFCTHNAFRAPSAPSLETLNEKLKKADYFSKIYGNMRKKIMSHSVFITEDNIAELLNVFDFVFVCIDNVKARKLIVEYLISNNIPFIDTGIGLNVCENKISGQVRSTFCQSSDTDSVNDMIPLEDMQVGDEYKTNIQIAELNALNAAFAVIRWKQTKEFYDDQIKPKNIVYSINDNLLLKS